MKKFKLIYYIAIFLAISLSIYTFCLFLINAHMASKMWTYCIITIIFSLFAGTILQTAFHEIGHVIFGIITRYKFVCMRIFYLVVQSQHNKIHFTQNQIRGVFGYTVMSPTSSEYKTQPFVLYSLGGVIFNAILSLILFSIAIATKINIYCKVVFFVCSFMGLVFVIRNGIPNIVNGLANDGYNAYSQLKHDATHESMYKQLKILSALYDGIHPNQMPKEWFLWNKNDPDVTNNPLLVNNLLNYCGKLMEEKNFTAAKSTFEHIAHDVDKSFSIYINEAKCELLFLALINGESIQNIYTDELKQYLKITRTCLNKKHVMYALYLIHEKDQVKANSVYNETLKLSENYIPKAEAEMELEMIDYIKKNLPKERIGAI